MYAFSVSETLSLYHQKKCVISFFSSLLKRTNQKEIFAYQKYRCSASWMSGKAFVSGAVGPKFKSRADRIEHSVANGLPPLRHFLKRRCVSGDDAEMGPKNSSHAWTQYRGYNEKFDLTFLQKKKGYTTMYC